MTKDEALKMAIETMKIWNGKSVKTNTALFRIDFEGAIQTCKEALEQPAQEPVKQKVKVLYEKNRIQTCEILPAPSWQGLSEEEIDKLYADWERGSWDYINFADAIEQALKEKNT